MNVTGCIPLAGRGLVARRGGLVALTDGTDAGPDPLLAALAEVADANGDGTALVRAATRAAVDRGERPAWACAGMTSAGEVAVLVHGAAAALISVDGSPESEVTASGSMIPVNRVVTGAVVTVRLVIGAPEAPDRRLCLDAGTVLGGGVLFTVAQEASRSPYPDDPRASAVSFAPPAVEQAAGDTVLRPAGQVPVGPVPARADVAPDAGLPGEAADRPRHEPTLQARAEPGSESWFRVEAQPPGPTVRVTEPDDAGAGGEPKSPTDGISAIELVPLDAVEPVVVDGTMCQQMHFNAPDALSCRECGISMHEVSRNVLRQPRPPLGVLLVDNGRRYPLDRDYVIGREPALDADVAAGRATALRISDSEGSVSRLHLRVSLVGWQVEIRDLESANGSVLYCADGPRALAPAEIAVLDPGARVAVGRRTVQFLPYRASPHGPTQME